ncbi:matrix metallo ase-23-like [Pelobates cultripes]|uniref:Matrix metallo ase-23-like n=1 Tax=Pelobates cultripes TaxID=61616 RepID=A0AAD1RCS0_PELCU|nr:matrix metallo ase-23-like [Pelobates cultripes]
MGCKLGAGWSGRILCNFVYILCTFTAISLLLFIFCAWHQQEPLGLPKGDYESSIATRWKRYTINPLGYKWDHLNLTYKIVKFPNTLNKADTQKAIEIAFRMWSRVSPLTFHSVQPHHDADLKIGKWVCK